MQNFTVTIGNGKPVSVVARHHRAAVCKAFKQGYGYRWDEGLPKYESMTAKVTGEDGIAKDFWRWELG